MLVSCITIIREFVKKNKKSYDFIFIAIFGAFLFYLFWEVNPRYSLSFLPWLMMTFGIGIADIEKMRDIQGICFRYDKYETNINIFKLNKAISIVTISLTAILLIINYYPYTGKESIYYDIRVIQPHGDGEESKIEILADKKVEQTFKIDKKFNCVSIKFKTGNVKNVTHYKFAIYDSDKNILNEQNFTSDDVEDGKYKFFTFDNIVPSGEQEYIIEIYSTDATEEDSIGISSFYAENYSSYEDGALSINGEETEADMTFRVQNKTMRTYTTKRVYIFLCIIVILLELFAFYPYLKYNRKMLEE